MKYLLYSVLLIPSVLFSQKVQAPDALWLGGQFNIRFADKWSWNNDGGYRTVSSTFIPYQNFFRTGFRYHFTNSFFATLGAAVFNTKTNFLKENREYGRETRFYFDINEQTPRSNKFIFDNRVRIEKRYFDATSSKKEYDTFRFIYRMLIGYRFAKHWGLSVGPEYFETLNKGVWSKDQLRVYAMLNTQIAQGLQSSLSYMYVNRPAYDQNVITWVLTKNIRLKSHHADHEHK